MTDTVFVNTVTLTDEDWFNDVNRLQYTIFADPTDITAAKVAIKAHPRMWISGLTYGNGDGAGGGDLTNDITITAGEAVDSTGVRLLQRTSSITKQLDAAWAVGTAAGGLDTGAIGNSDYYIWLICRIDTFVVDVLFSLSSTAPTMPTNYTLKRLIGWFKRVGATIVVFKTYELEGGGLELGWTTPTVDVSSVSVSSASTAFAIKVPLNLSTLADLRFRMDDIGGSDVIIQCPDETNAAPSSSIGPLLDFVIPAAGQATGRMRIRTSATGTIAVRASAAVDVFRALTVGFRWGRRD